MGSVAMPKTMAHGHKTAALVWRRRCAAASRAAMPNTGRLVKTKKGKAGVGLLNAGEVMGIAT
jgi:hypothetical protein